MPDAGAAIALLAPDATAGLAGCTAAADLAFPEPAALLFADGLPADACEV